MYLNRKEGSPHRIELGKYATGDEERERKTYKADGSLRRTLGIA
jgi:hypothetical protein